MLVFINDFMDKTIDESILYQLSIIKGLKEYFEINIDNVEKARQTYKGAQLEKAVNKLHQSFFEFCASYFEEKGKVALTEIRDTLSRGIVALQSKIGNFIYETPESIIVLVQHDRGKEKNITVQYRKLVASSIYNNLVPEVLNYLGSFETRTARLYADLKNIVLQVNDIYLKQHLDNKNDLSGLKQTILYNFSELESVLQNQSDEIKTGLISLARNQVIDVSSDLTSVDLRSRIKNKLKAKPTKTFDDIMSVPEDWFVSASLLNNGLFLDSQILSEQKVISGILQNFNEKIYSGYSEKVLAPINTLLTNIDKALDSTSDKMGKVIFADNTEVRYLFQETYYKIAEILDWLPEEIEISELNYIEGEADNKLENFFPIVVEPYKIARYYFDTRLYDPLYRELEQTDELVKQIVGECREANSLFRFRLDNVQQNRPENIQNVQNFGVFLHSLKKQVQGEKNRLIEAIERIQFKSEESIKNAVSPLYSHSITQAEKKISSMVRDQKGKKFTLSFNKKFKSLATSFNHLILNILYSSSGGVIQTKKILKKQTDTITSVSDILNINEKVMPDKKILSQLPVFYRTLFSSKSLINDDFWISMEKEISEIKNAWHRHRNGYGGAVLITGVHGSGKTALTRYCATHLFKKDRIYTITAPLEGSVNKEDWLSALQMATGQQGNSTDIFRNLLPDNTIIINDLELWWERSVTGSEVLKEIIELVHIFGRKSFFIINCNIHAYNLINKILPLNENFISVVECEPFNARELKSLIQNRHKSSGLTYYFKNKAEEELLQIRTATLFNSFFSFSDGIPGVALNAWLRSITKVEGQNIYIEKPELPNIDILYRISDDWLIIIALFIQHKNMNSSKLARVMKFSDEDSEKNITNLTNAGILEHRENDIYIIARHIEPFLVKVCSEKGII